MRMLLLYGDKQMELLRQEYKLLMINWHLEPQRKARRQAALRKEGEAKDNGKLLGRDLASKAQQNMYLDQLLEQAHSFTPEGAAGALGRGEQRQREWRQKQRQLVLERMENSEAVVETILGHCVGCQQGHGDDVSEHVETLFWVRWQDYDGSDSYVSQVDLTNGWATRRRNLEMLQEYATTSGLELGPVAMELSDSDSEGADAEDATYEDEVDIPTKSMNNFLAAMARLHQSEAASDGLVPSENEGWDSENEGWYSSDDFDDE